MRLSNQQLKELRRLQDKKYRRKTQLFLIEGLRLCEEAVNANVVIRMIIFCDEQMNHRRMTKLLRTVEARNVTILFAEVKQLSALTSTETPQGVVAVVEHLNPRPFRQTLPEQKLALALDGLADPGNLGAILRSASWFGIKSVYLNSGCVDVYNPKVVRSTMGAIFHLDLYENMDLLELLKVAREFGFRCIATFPQVGEPLNSVLSTQKDLVIIGSEAHGIAKSVTAQIDVGITIPLWGRGDSLNASVATGIVLYELTKKRK